MPDLCCCYSPSDLLLQVLAAVVEAGFFMSQPVVAPAVPKAMVARDEALAQVGRV